MAQRPEGMLKSAPKMDQSEQCCSVPLSSGRAWFYYVAISRREVDALLVRYLQGTANALNDL